MAKIGFISLGCPKNLVDSEVMLGQLKKAGHTITTERSEAEILVVNTCSFVEGSKRESIETILEAAELKRTGACQRLVVAGCLAERYPDEIRADLPEVDVLVGTNQIEEIGRAVEGETIPPPSSFGRSDADLYLYDDTTPRLLTAPRFSAYMKIAEGCDHTCSFCIIPKIRGRFRSRTIPSLVREAESLVSQGVREITLVSQDTTSYGIDLGLEDGLARLLEALDGVQGIGWIRFLYVYPNLVGDRLAQIVASSGRICSYIDMPLQHVSSRILRAMKRGGNRSTLAKMIERIRERIPDVTIRTTMIVGFPGETVGDFEELLGFCRDMEFDRLGVFAYSDEENTDAYNLGGKLPPETAEERRAVLMKQQAAISRRKNRRLLGAELPVLIEGASEESDMILQGRLQSQAPGIDGVCLINDSRVRGLEPGEFRILRVTRALEHDLVGTIMR